MSEEQEKKDVFLLKRSQNVVKKKGGVGGGRGTEREREKTDGPTAQFPPSRNYIDLDVVHYRLKNLKNEGTQGKGQVLRSQAGISAAQLAAQYVKSGWEPSLRPNS